MNEKITIRGAEYKISIGAHKGEMPTYTLIGKRGAKYYTMRNKPDPKLMFLVREGAKVTGHALDRVWLTDKNGILEEVDVM